MAQPHKGNRHLVQSRIPDPAYAEIKLRAAEAGLSVSQYVADLMCLCVGKPDQVRALRTASLFDEQTEVPLADIA